MFVIRQMIKTLVDETHGAYDLLMESLKVIEQWMDNHPEYSKDLVWIPELKKSMMKCAPQPKYLGIGFSKKSPKLESRHST